MEVVFGSTWVQLNEMPDEEATAVLKMTVDLAKFVKAPLGHWRGWGSPGGWGGDGEGMGIQDPDGDG